MQTQTVRNSSILPLLLPWLGFLALTVSMPACDLKPRTADQGQSLGEQRLEIDAARSETAPASAVPTKVTWRTAPR